MIHCIRWLIAPLIFSTAFALQGGEPVTKRVEVDKTQQVLRAYEGDRLVFQSRISTGKWDRSTPNGNFAVGIKHIMHYSRRYNNAPMPFSVQVNGNIFIHGFTSVPARPASHGCIRLPLDGDNPAKWFFNWADPGTPVTVSGQWQQPGPAKKE